jgi:hypothetical protein
VYVIFLVLITLMLTKRAGAWRIPAGQNAKLSEGIK